MESEGQPAGLGQWRSMTATVNIYLRLYAIVVHCSTSSDEVRCVDHLVLNGDVG